MAEIKKINGNALCDETAREKADAAQAVADEAKGLAETAGEGATEAKTAAETAQETADTALNNEFGVAKVLEYDASKKQLLGQRFLESGTSKKEAIVGTNITGTTAITVGPKTYAMQNCDNHNIVATYTAEDGMHVLSGAFTNPFGTEVELTETVVPLGKEYTAGDGIAIEDGVITADVSGKLDKENPVATGSFSLGRKSGTTVGVGSFAVGGDTSATNAYSTAFGSGSLALGLAATAEGYQTIASGHSSHAEGYGTIANGIANHVQGMYNVDQEDVAESDYPEYLHIVGNGSSDSSRSNAHTLDRSGNAWFSGDVYVGSTSGTNKDEGSVKLAKVTETVSTADTATEATEFYLKSSTADSEKRFKITVDDTGALTATEVV